jgi:hypothetical protein
MTGQIFRQNEMALSIMVEFFRPIIQKSMQDPEERREKERQYLRAHEDLANYQCVTSHSPES